MQNITDLQEESTWHNPDQMDHIQLSGAFADRIFSSSADPNRQNKTEKHCRALFSTQFIQSFLIKYSKVVRENYC
jgi:hypothetical protein